GSKKVLHLHGELRKSQSSTDASLVYDIKGWEVKKGELCEKGSQLRPHVVWFGEMVPMIEPAQELVAQGDLLVVVGTSLNVYPAAGLLHSVRPGTPIIAVDPAPLELRHFPEAFHIREKAGSGIQKLVDHLRAGQ
ncbi:MAG: Sir2 family NAD-dependent protein deacetylase, partial [Owenweeksia sp.]